MPQAPRTQSESRAEPSAARAASLTVAAAGRTVTALLSERLGLPTALLSQSDGAWRFEAEGWPAGREMTGADALATVPSSIDAFPHNESSGWTGIALGQSTEGGGSKWMLLLPGRPDEWEGTSVVSQLVPDMGALLEEAAERELDEERRASARRYHRFCLRLNRMQTPAGLQRLILRTVAAEVRADVGALALFSEAEQRLAIVATLGYPQQLVEHVRIGSGEGVLGTVHKSGRPLLEVGGSLATPRRLRYRSDSYLAVPLAGPSGVLGVLTLTDRRDGRPFAADDLAAVRLLAGPAALALTTQKLRQSADEVTRLASIDPLTGLFNRRYFDARLEAEQQRARRHAEPLALLMVDIDNFKAINDDRGHVVGDQLLRCVSDRLRRGVRIFDVCARYGGDEFAILMPSSNVDTAVLVAERIRSSVGSHCAYDSSHVTVSIGIAHGSERDILSIADHALLAAKGMGKNAVCVAPPFAGGAARQENS